MYSHTQTKSSLKGEKATPTRKRKRKQKKRRMMTMTTMTTGRTFAQSRVAQCPKKRGVVAATNTTTHAHCIVTSSRRWCLPIKMTSNNTMSRLANRRRRQKMCSRDRGSAVVVSANLFSRFTRVVSSYANACLLYTSPSPRD